VSGVEVSSFWGALLAAIVLTLVNTFVRPILIILTLPVTIFTLGFFILVVNGVSLLLAAAISGGAFQIHGVGAAIIAWLVFTIINWAITSLFRRRHVTVIER
jgi:putative membrane protein